MDLRGKKIEFADSGEVEDREREVRYIFNIVQPDPEYQPIFLSDEMKDKFPEWPHEFTARH